MLNLNADFIMWSWCSEVVFLSDVFLLFVIVLEVYGLQTREGKDAAVS